MTTPLRLELGARDASPRDATETALFAERHGFDGVQMAETQHDPLIGCALAGSATERIRVSTAIAVAFARSPMALATTANDVQLATQGRFALGLGSQVRAHIERRFSMPWSSPVPRMREFIAALRAIWGAVGDGGGPRLPGRAVPAHPDDAVLQPRPQPVRRP